MPTMEIVIQTLVACLIVSLCSLTGAFALWMSIDALKRIVPILVALAVGVLLGDAFIHLIPDAIERYDSVSEICLIVLISVFGFFILEKLVRWRHDHRVKFPPQNSEVPPLATMNLFGDAIHNFVDGILIAGSFIVDPLLGLTTTMTVVIHEFPQEIGDIGALLHGGFKPRKAILYNFYCSLSVVPGAIFTLLLSQIANSSLVVLLPIAAGGFIYIAASDLIPVLHEHSSVRHAAAQIAAFAVGIACMQSLVLFEKTVLNT